MTRAAIESLIRRAAILTGAWTIPVVLGVAGHYFGQMVGDASMPATHYFGHSVALWYVWIAATPVIFWIHRRQFPAPWMVAAHVLTLGATFAAQSWLTVVVGHATGHVPLHVSFRENVGAAVVNLLLYDVLVYGGVVAVAVGIDYGRRYRDRDLRAAQLETQLERARLTALQTQLQPHFLFNALNAIAMLVRRERNREAVEAIVGFSELLRYVLDESGSVDVSLAEELAFVRRYLEIERVRLGDRLIVDIDVEPGVERAVIPNLLLQPLVENAVKHAIAVRPQGGSLWVRAARAGPSLRLEVADDGPGLPIEFDARDAPGRGLGLRNLRERLDAFYAGNGRCVIGARPGGGTLVTIEIPLALEGAGPRDAAPRESAHAILA